MNNYEKNVQVFDIANDTGAKVGAIVRVAKDGTKRVRVGYVEAMIGSSVPKRTYTTVTLRLEDGRFRSTRLSDVEHAVIL